MPASLVHMLIAHKALKRLSESGEEGIADFAKDLNDEKTGNKAYVNLGSVGPDLYYFEDLHENVIKEAGKKICKKLKKYEVLKNIYEKYEKIVFKSEAKDKLMKPAGVVPWSYHLHSAQPNEFVLKLAEIIFKDVKRENGEPQIGKLDHKKLAYVAGHLTHIAGDQIVHPLVNDVAGPYYISEGNREKHRECEVYQDYYVYRELYKDEDESTKEYDFFKQEFHEWVDGVKKDLFGSTWKWFRYFLQRGFAETYGGFPTGEVIEDSVDNLLLVLRFCKKVGPYAEAAEDYGENGHGEKFAEYVTETHYMDRFEEAVEQSIKYLRALYKVYDVLQRNEGFTEQQKRDFLEAVSDADLSCPLAVV